MKKPNPCLWFDGQATEAAEFYTSVFKNSKIIKGARYSESSSKASGQKKDSVMTVEFEIEGLKFLGLNGGPYFKFSPGISFFVSRESEKEIDELWAKLSSGKVLFELKKYPWSDKYGWCEDKYGVTWQLSLPKNKPSIAPAFLFVNELFGKGEEAIKFYTSLFENSKIENIHRDPSTKSVMHASFSLDGQDFVLMEGQGEHKHSITPAISFVVGCDTQAEIDRYWNALGADGGKPNQCGWEADKFGVSWQIVPSQLGEWTQKPGASERVMAALMKMKKLDLGILKAASEG